MSHAGNDEIIDNKKDTLFCDNCGEINPNYHIGKMPVNFESGNSGESASLCEDCFKLLIPIQCYYQLIKHFEYLLESNNYRDQVINFMTGHFEKHLTEDLLQELKDSLRL